MRSWQKQTLLTTTAALLVAGTSSFAQDVDLGTVAQLANVAGGNETAAYRLGLDYSEDLGVSALGNFGLMMGEGAAIGFVLRGGENVTEGLLNLGFNLPQNYTLMLSGGVLRENLFVDDEVGREWVRQEEYALGLEGDKFAFNAFLTDSDSTENYVGARSYGAEVSSEFTLSDSATLSGNIGYQRIEWKDDSADDEGVTGGLDLTVASDWGVSYGAFADYGVSEAVYGVRAEVPVGNGSLSASYAYVDGLVGAVGDDQRVQIAFNMPVGGSVASAVSTSGASSTMTSYRPSLLADVMTRPSYLPERVIVKNAVHEEFDPSTCVSLTWDEQSSLTIDGGFVSPVYPFVTPVTDGDYELFALTGGESGLFINFGLEGPTVQVQYIGQVSIANNTMDLSGNSQNSLFLAGGPGGFLLPSGFSSCDAAPTLLWST